MPRARARTYSIYRTVQGPYEAHFYDSVFLKLPLLETGARGIRERACGQVIGDRGLPPFMYPTKFIFNVYENGDEVVQIFARQLIDQIPRGYPFNSTTPP